MATTKAKATKKTTTTKKDTSVSVYDISGKSKGKTQLPEELFDAKINEPLMTQAVNVYLSNQRRGTVAQKTRSEVRASRRKIYRQKGTGRARHGALSAPIFVGGGVTFAAKPRQYTKKMSKKMKLSALRSALSSQKKKENVMVADLEKVKGKTREIASALNAMKIGKESVLLLADGKNDALKRAVSNIKELTFLPADSANTYQVLKNKKLLLTKEGLDIMKKHFVKEDK